MTKEELICEVSTLTYDQLVALRDYLEHLKEGSRDDGM